MLLNQQHRLGLGFLKQKPACGTGTPGPPNGGKRACRNPAGLWIPAEPSGRQSTHPAAPRKAGATGEHGRHAAAGAPWQPPPPRHPPPHRCPSCAVRGQKAPSPWELPGEATAPCACWKPSAPAPRARGLPLLSPLPPATPSAGRRQRGCSSPAAPVRAFLQTTTKDERAHLPPGFPSPLPAEPSRDPSAAGRPRLLRARPAASRHGAGRGGGAMPARGGRRVIGRGSYATDNFPA